MEKTIYEHYVPIPMIPEFIGTCLICQNSISALRQRSLLVAYETTARMYSGYKERVIRNTMPNNWLKLHGYRMRRRVR